MLRLDDLIEQDAYDECVSGTGTAKHQSHAFPQVPLLLISLRQRVCLRHLNKPKNPAQYILTLRLSFKTTGPQPSDTLIMAPCH